MDQAITNRLWSRIILEELARLGVTEICLAPGSRSTPLTLEADASDKLNLHTHFDERGLGYLALGLAKASQQPVAVIVTSGTAVANLLPAIAESRLTGEKLVILTADRPAELIDCGANQAIEQAGIFTHHVTGAVNLPSPSVSIAPGWLLTTIDQMMFRQQQEGGAVHINCPFPEPLYTTQSPDSQCPYLLPVKSWFDSDSPYCEQVMPSVVTVADFDPDKLKQRGVVVIGSLDLAAAQQAKAFARKLGWPVLCDPQSGQGSEWAYFDLWLQHPQLSEQLSACDVVIQFGSRLVSKRLNHWLSQLGQSGCHYVFVSPQKSRNNQFHLPQHHIVADVSQWIETMQRHLTATESAGWADEMLPVIRKIPAVIQKIAAQESCFSDTESAKAGSFKTDSFKTDHAKTDCSVKNCSGKNCSEMEIAASLASLAPQADLFLGNSLIVRLVDMFSCQQPRHVFSNRGASGIDGIIATAAGVQRWRKQPLLLMMGDTSFLYDLNAMALLSHCEVPFVIVVINNDGGAIFDLLPVPAEKKTALYQMPHGYQFGHAAQLFGWSYCQPQTQAEYVERIETHLAEGQGGLLVEVITPPEQVAEHIRQVVQHVRAL